MAVGAMAKRLRRPRDPVELGQIPIERPCRTADLLRSGVTPTEFRVFACDTMT